MSTTTQCPYTIWELQFAALKVEDKLTDELRKDIEALEEKPEDNLKNVAAFNGISLEILINSPNMDVLIKRYSDYNIQKFLDICMTHNLTRKEAWAVLMAAINPSILE